MQVLRLIFSILLLSFILISCSKELDEDLNNNVFDKDYNGPDYLSIDTIIPNYEADVFTNIEVRYTIDGNSVRDYETMDFTLVLWKDSIRIQDVRPLNPETQAIDVSEKGFYFKVFLHGDTIRHSYQISVTSLAELGLEPDVFITDKLYYPYE